MYDIIYHIIYHIKYHIQYHIKYFIKYYINYYIIYIILCMNVCVCVSSIPSISLSFFNHTTTVLQSKSAKALDDVVHSDDHLGRLWRGSQVEKRHGHP